MNEPFYPFEASPNQFRYEFESVSEEKIVRKVVVFQETRLSAFYNLALLDLLDSGKESDSSITDNQDLRIVMATVMRIVADFLNQFPSYRVYFKGNDQRKTRLYRIVIGREISQLRETFNVAGETDGKLVRFEPNTDYEGFVVTLKKGANDEDA